MSGIHEHCFQIKLVFLKKFMVIFFPKYQQFGINEQSQVNYQIMNFLGVSIDEIQTYFDNHFDIEVVYHANFIILGIILAFHSFDYVHRDIKPINFGLSKKHIDPTTNKPFPCENENSFLGTRKYFSSNAVD